ncbi:hypothetical protein MUP35_00670 [Patescibacteria group bacterium]|nr:hypothetical protein [Patescibacteria group bacterium]
MNKLQSAKIKRRKNFLPALILTLIFWGGLSWLVYTSPPESFWLIISFYLLLFAAVFFTTALSFGNSKIGLIAALWAILFLLLCYFKIGNLLNLSLLTLIFSLLGFYLYRAKS